MRKYVCLFVILFILPLLMGQGCMGPVAETNEQRAYRVCGQAGFTRDYTTTLFGMAESDRLSGNTYAQEIASVMDGCDQRCNYTPGNCTSFCYMCGEALADATYYGKDTIVQRETGDESAQLMEGIISSPPNEPE